MSQRRRRVGPAVLAVAALVLISIPLAAPGLALVPGAATGAPGWLRGIYGSGLGISPETYLALLYVAVGIWVATWVLAGGLPRGAMRWIGGGLIALFALAPPLLSLDVFSYISYARLGSRGLNPYELAPDAIPADEAAGRVEDFRSAVSVYGPLFTLGSIPLGSLGVPAALWSLKAVAAVSVAGIAGLSARLAAVRGLDPSAAAAFVALNPLVLVHLVGGAHNDGLMTLLAMLSIAAALSSRPALAGVGLVGAASIKVSGALYAPFAVVGSPARGRLMTGVAATGALVVVAALACFGPDALEALSVAGGNQATISHWSVPATLSRITSLDVDLLRGVLGVTYAAVVLGLLHRVSRGADWVRAAGWAALGLLVASAYLVPWYLIWLLPLAAISRDRVLVGLTVLLTLFQVVNGVPV